MVNTKAQNSNEILQRRIEEKRTELLDLAAKNGLTSYIVLRCSTELDQLIYQMLILKENKSEEDSYKEGSYT